MSHDLYLTVPLEQDLYHVTKHARRSRFRGGVEEEKEEEEEYNKKNRLKAPEALKRGSANRLRAY